MLALTDKQRCTGCFACMELCTENNITAKADTEGFLYPYRAERDVCGGCGLCGKRCTDEGVVNSRQACGEIYAACGKYMSDEYDAFPGGMFTLIAANVIYGGGVVCAARYDEKGGAAYGFAESFEELRSFRDDVYAQAVAGGGIYRRVAGYLDGGRTVLFCGAPCRAAALASYLGRDYDRLYCIDTICRGSVSPEAIRVLGEYGIAPLFEKNLCLRPACYRCRFKYPHSSADMTLGAFSGIGEIMPEMDGGRETALVAVNSVKGRALFDTVKSYAIYRTADTADAVRYNPLLTAPAETNPDRDMFYRDLNKLSPAELIKKYRGDITYISPARLSLI